MQSARAVHDLIEVHKGSALDLPFSDDSFDVVWMQNVGMNIADTRKLYAEFYRVLNSGGRFAFQEMAAGKAATSFYPFSWATDPADNYFVSFEETRSLLGESGFIAELLEDTSDAHLSGATANAAPAGALFANNLVVARPVPECRFTLFNRTLTWRTLLAVETRQTLESVEALQLTLDKVFHINPPEAEVAKAWEVSGCGQPHGPAFS